MRRLIIALLIALSLSSCTSVTPSHVQVQESLLTECTSDTPIPEGLTGTDAYKALNEWQATYNVCRAKQAALIQAVRGLP